MVEMILHTALLSQRIRLRYRQNAPVEMEGQVNLRPRHHIIMQPEMRS